MTRMVELPALHDPRLTIVIVNYNYGRYVGDAIESALVQRTKAWQIIVVDDGSTDNSRAVMERYNNRVQLIFTENGGQRSAYNAGFSQATGDVILFLDSDDMLDPDALTEIATCFSEDVSKVHFKLRLIDMHGSPVGVTIPSQLDHGDVSGMIDAGMMYCSSPGSGNAYRASVLRILLPLPLSNVDRHGADYFAIVGCGMLGCVVALNKVLGDYRVHKSVGDKQQALLLGNAAKLGDEYSLVKSRTRHCSAWLNERTRGRITTPESFLDFSMEKCAYASAVLEADSLWKRVRKARDYFPALLKSTYARKDFGWMKRTVVIAWALFIVCMPQVIAFRAARYVCNPASR